MGGLTATWTGYGYAIVRVDERGAGQSPGYLDPLSTRTVEDYKEAIEWVAEQSWSSGKVGLSGVSYILLIASQDWLS